MAMKKCPDCNQKYSDTYKKCPFCEEEKKIRKGKRIRKRNTRNGRRTAGSDRENILTLVLLVIMLVLAGILLWLLFGGGSEDVPDPGTSSGSVSEDPGSTDPVDPPSSGTTDPDPGTNPGPGMPEDPLPPTSSVDNVKSLPHELKLSNEDFTAKVGDAPVQLRVSGGTGVYTWVSDKPEVATVDSNGKVTAIANGTANVYATDGKVMGKCIVRVKGGSAPVTPSNPSTPSNPTTPSDPSAANATLNKTDMTLSVGEIYPLKVKNYEGTVTWSVSDSSIASVLNDGTVKGLKAGRTTVTATVGDRTLKCIVRIKN